MLRRATQICKNYLVSCCPHEMFYNTKSDLGQCNSVHDEHLQTQYALSLWHANAHIRTGPNDRVGGSERASERRYQNSDKRYKLGYEQQFVAYVTDIITNLDKKYADTMPHTLCCILEPHRIRATGCTGRREQNPHRQGPPGQAHRRNSTAPP